MAAAMLTIAGRPRSKPAATAMPVSGFQGVARSSVNSKIVDK
jgi:hypothetical protein